MFGSGLVICLDLHISISLNDFSNLFTTLEGSLGSFDLVDAALRSCIVYNCDVWVGWKAVSVIQIGSNSGCDQCDSSRSRHIQYMYRCGCVHVQVYKKATDGLMWCGEKSCVTSFFCPSPVEQASRYVVLRNHHGLSISLLVVFLPPLSSWMYLKSS